MHHRRIQDNASDSEHNSNQTAISERLATVQPSKCNDQASLEMANDSTADRSSLVDNDELRCGDQACEDAALKVVSRGTELILGGLTRTISNQVEPLITFHAVTSSENGITYSMSNTLTGA